MSGAIQMVLVSVPMRAEIQGLWRHQELMEAACDYGGAKSFVARRPAPGGCPTLSESPPTRRDRASLGHPPVAAPNCVEARVIARPPVGTDVEIELRVAVALS